MQVGRVVVDSKSDVRRQSWSVGTKAMLSWVQVFGVMGEGEEGWQLGWVRVFEEIKERKKEE